MRFRIATWLNRLAILFDERYDFRATHLSFQFIQREGLVVNDQDKGTRLWYQKPTYDAAWQHENSAGA